LRELRELRELRKPGALAGSKPLAAWQEKGLWPTCFDEFWSELNRRHGKQSGTRKMIELLQIGRNYQPGRRQEIVLRTRRHAFTTTKHVLLATDLHAGGRIGSPGS
jgi:hypothetical protein